MGWLQRLFGMEKPPAAAPAAATPDSTTTASEAIVATTATIAPERMGLNGEYDQSGLAKRVAWAFDQDAELTNIPSIDILQTGTTVVLQGQAPSQSIVNKLISIAGTVSGATDVDTTGLSIGIPPERVGLNGEYDESGLAKRVVQALGQNASLSSAAPFDVAQTGGTVVIQGKVPSQEILSQMVAIAKGVSGATSVNTDKVSLG